MITKQQLSKMKKWFYPYICTHENMMMSGWKLYIFGETVNDSFKICEMVTPVMKKYNITMKVATQYIIDRNAVKPNEAWSIAVVYLHPEIFAKRKLSSLIQDINHSLEGYKKKGIIKGAKSIDGKIHYRYDLNRPVIPSFGVEYSEYLRMYRGGKGDYNIKGNDDITRFFIQ